MKFTRPFNRALFVSARTEPLAVLRPLWLPCKEETFPACDPKLENINSRAL